MFDDQPISSNNPPVPGNLPMGEPQDMFEGTDTGGTLPPPPMDALSSSPQVSSATALNAGILKPKASEPPSYTTPPVMAGENTIKEPKLSRGIMFTIMALVIAFVLIGSGWFVYHIFTKKTPEIVVPPNPEINVPPTEVPIVEPTSPVPVVDVTQTTSSDAVDREIIVGESPDSDGDGLKDDREKELGTDPSDWDSDKDDLSDGEEMFIWHTNPKVADTDGDTYKDGAEVKAGYNPSGPGRLAEITSLTPSSTSSTSPDMTSFASTTFGVQPITPPTTTTTSPSSSFQIEL